MYKVSSVVSHDSMTMTCDQHDAPVTVVTPCHITLSLLQFKMRDKRKEKRNRKIQVKNKRDFR